MKINFSVLRFIGKVLNLIQLNPKYSWDYVWGRYLTIEDEDNEEYLQLIDEAKILWYDPNCIPFTVEEANKLTNQEQKELILSEIEKNNKKKLENIK